MSPLFNPGPRIALLPGQAALALGGRAADEARGPGADWAGALAALEQLLPRAGASGRARVTLSHHFVRLFLLPAPATWLKPAEMRPWLRDRLDGPLAGAADWLFSWRLTPPGRPILVAAVPQGQLDELTQTLGHRGLKLDRLRPWLSDAWSRRQRRLGGASGWYALAEPGQLLLLRLAGGRIDALRQRQLGAEVAAEVAAELQALLTREALLDGVEPGGKVWLEWAGLNLDGAALGAAYRVEALAGARDVAGAFLS